MSIFCIASRRSFSVMRALPFRRNQQGFSAWTNDVFPDFSNRRRSAVAGPTRAFYDRFTLTLPAHRAARWRPSGDGEVVDPLGGSCHCDPRIAVGFDLRRCLLALRKEAASIGARPRENGTLVPAHVRIIHVAGCQTRTVRSSTTACSLRLSGHERTKARASVVGMRAK